MEHNTIARVARKNSQMRQQLGESRRTEVLLSKVRYEGGAGGAAPLRFDSACRTPHSQLITETL